MTEFTIAEASELLRRKQISPVELTRNCLARIERLNPSINAFITVMHESALAEARAAEAEINSGSWRGPLHGIPIGIKDLIDTAGVKTTCASALFADRVPTEDAHIVQLLQRAGAVLLGKQNLQEFAYGGTSTSSYFGPVRNPWDTQRIAGGSSGGSAAAVATGMCFAAIGTDTGGSVREPAAFCGIVGLKPTYGRVSARGVFPLSPSLDHVGPLCRNVRDTALMLEVIAGYDKLDITSVEWPVDSYTSGLTQATKSRVGIVRHPFFDNLDNDIATAIEEALKQISNISSDMVDIDLPPTPTAVQAPEVYAIHAKTFAESPELYGRWIRERLKQAALVDTISYIEARQHLDRVRRSIEEVFLKVDFLITPTTPVPPISIDEALNMSPDPAGELWLRNTRPFNAYGLPTISLPCGFTRDGLPIGLQISAARFSETKLLSFAFEYEQAPGWDKRTPPCLESV
ncbi:MAG TPA: amidase [Pyrinomonadaceae bacterium]|jgi:aspartyl-tRNA(Asn)/glutamyl-tRNA(Gln) amidotransferase subunit A|nr:amidase [Pyrinomonadaceae bacterium]